MFTAEALRAMQRANCAFAQSHDFSLLDNRLLAVVKLGSHAYGTSTPDSDTDFHAVVTPPPRHVFGLGQWESWEPGVEDGLDLKVWALRKFVKLAAQGNPNVVEMLFFPDDCYGYVAPAFQPLLDVRDAFLSREAFKRFSGYADGQMKKMTQGAKTGHMGHKRFEVVKALGYDPKDASHLIRLLFKGNELARFGTLTPRLDGYQRDQVMEIKLGQWSLDEVKNLAAMLVGVNEAWFHDPACPLPAQPDLPRIERALVDVHWETL